MASPLNLNLIDSLKFNETRIYFSGKSSLEITVSLNRRIIIVKRINSEKQLQMRIYTPIEHIIDIILH